MQLTRISRAVGAAILALGMVAGAGAAPAAAASAKKITCYKGTAAKTLAAAKCPSGWSNAKPAAAKPAASSSKSVSLSATYKGKLTMVWTASDVKVTELNGTSADAGANGLKEMSATGSSAPQSACAAIAGLGSLSGADGKLTFKVDSSTKGCGANEAAPSPVSVSGSATVTGGTGKYAGATGSLTIKGTFFVKSTQAGTNDTQDFSATFAGDIKLK